MEKKQRTEQYEIGGTVYTVIVEENEKAKETPLDIMRRLVERNTYKSYGKIGRTCCLQTNGGKKIC